MSARLYIDGIALWAPAWPGWHCARAALRGEPVTVAPVARPAPALLGANERRRIPDAVRLALQVAQAAVEASGQDPARLPSVFSSAHGDLGVVDALCRTLSDNPLLLSPTRFHHSVHNAASGYWAMATHCHAASTAVSGHEHSFATGWLEAATQLAADSTPVLLVGYDTEARGALASVNRSRGLLGLALVLCPVSTPRSLCRVDWQLRSGSSAPPRLQTAAAQALAGNAMADGLPLFEALAADRPTRLVLPLGPRLGLELAVQPLHPTPHDPLAA